MNIEKKGTCLFLCNIDTRVNTCHNKEVQMKTQELLKLLRKQFPVPRHKAEIPIGTLNSILKEAGLK